MSDDALAYLVEAFGHVSDAELQSFLDGTPVSAPPVPDLGKAALAATVLPSSPLVRPEPAQAA